MVGKGPGVIIEFRGRERWREYLERLEQADDEGGTLSPGGASRLLKVSRQRVNTLVETNPGIRAWAYYEDWSRHVVSLEISVPDLCAWLVQQGRPPGWYTPLIEAAYQKALHKATDVATMQPSGS